MSNELIFKSNAFFETVTYDRDSDSYYFLFNENISITVTGFWRILIENKINIVSLDNGQQFGLLKTINLVEITTKILKDKKLKEIKINKETADLTLTFSNNIKLEVYISSSGYETYSLSLKEKRYLGLGSGEIEIMKLS